MAHRSLTAKTDERYFDVRAAPKICTGEKWRLTTIASFPPPTQRKENLVYTEGDKNTTPVASHKVLPLLSKRWTKKTHTN